MDDLGWIADRTALSNRALLIILNSFRLIIRGEESCGSASAEDGGLGTGAIFGIVLGSLAGALSLCCCCYCCFCGKCKDWNGTGGSSSSSYYGGHHCGGGGGWSSGVGGGGGGGFSSGDGGGGGGGDF